MQQKEPLCETKATYDSYLLCMSSPIGGSSETQRSRFQMEGRRVITDKRSTTTAWSLRDTEWSTAEKYQKII
jgi:hypothetical protein